MIPAVAYLRMSDLRQDTSLGDQRGAITRYAKDRGIRIIREYVDEGISGDRTEKRAAFQLMIADSSKGDFKAVVSWDIDRFGRFDPLEAGYWIHPLRQRGVWLETVAQGRIDWNDFSGRILYTVQQEAKHGYLKDLARNVLRGMIRSANEGRLMWNPPLGYSNVNGEFVPNDDAHTVRRIFAEYLDGQSFGEIASLLNRESGVSTWTRTRVRGVLVNEAYTGVYIWGTEAKGKYGRVVNGEVAPAKRGAGSPIRIENHHQPLVDAETFALAAQRRSENRKRTSPKRDRPFIFSGIVYCGSCGSLMYGRDRRGVMIYQCRRAVAAGCCKRNTVYESELLTRVIDKLTERVKGKAYREALASEVRKQDLERKKAKAESPELKRRLQAVEGKIAKAQKRLVECDSQFVQIVQEHLSELMAEKQAITARLQVASSAAQKLDIERQVQDAVGLVDSLSELAKRADPRIVRDHIRKLVSRVECHVRSVPWGKHRTVYELEHIELDALS